MKNKKLRIILCSASVIVALSAAFLLVRHLISVRNAVPFTPSEKKVIEFGSYPQSRVTDDTLIIALNGISAEWKSYGYYSGDDSFGSAKQSDYMQYTDISYNGERYRGIRFSDYRPYCCHVRHEISWQKHLYGLKTDTVYWYRFDPIRWIVLSEEEHFLFSEKILDSQPFNSIIYVKDPESDPVLQDYYKDADCTIYATDYYTSDLRAWLNSSFYETAFSPEEAERIEVTELDNSAWNKRYSQFDSQNSCDKVFFLSYDEATNPEYGFSKQAEKSDDLRTGFPSDYALSQCVWTVGGVYKIGGCYTWLRTAGTNTTQTCGPNTYGCITTEIINPYSPDCVDTGVRPAIRLSELPN